MRKHLLSIIALLCLTVTSAWADSYPDYVTDVKVVGYESKQTLSELQTHYPGWIVVDYDLNKGAYGDAIYLLYKTASRNNTNGGYITDFKLMTGEDTPPKSTTIDGVTYYRADFGGGSDYFIDQWGDLNRGAGGPTLILYYTKHNFSDKRVVTGISFDDSSSNAITYHNDNTKPGDFNQGAKPGSSPHIYMHLTTTTKTNRPSSDPVTVNGLVYNGSAQQLLNINNSNTGTMMYRMGTSVDFSPSPTATAAGTYTVYYHASADDYGNEGNTFSQSVTISKSNNNGVTISCGNAMENEGPSPSISGNLSSGSVTYQYSTSQNGSYSSTAPNTAGTYWVRATIAADNNCNAYTTSAVSFTLRRDWAIHNSGDTEADAYVITSTEDLDLLAQRVNNGTSDYKNKYFKLDNDITYSHTKDWNDATSNENNYTPIGKNYYYFKGTFDGKGHTVSGIRVKSLDNFIGLFGYINNGAVVKNVIVRDARIIGYHYSGGIAGKCDYSTITNCWVKSNVCVGNRDEIGGISGGCYSGTISGCRCEATLIAAASNNECYGGITGTSSFTTISDCVVDGATIPEISKYYGAVAGEKYVSTYTNNYYTACTVAGVANAAKVGCDGYDQDGARRARTITLGTGITLSGTVTTYDISGLTAIGTTALRRGNTIYSGEGQTLSLGYNGTVPTDYTLSWTATNGGTISGNINDGYTLTIPAANVTVTAVLTPPENISLSAKQVGDNYWTTFYCGDGGYKIDDAENACAYTATYSSSTLTLHKLGKVIPAGTAVILVGADNDISMTASTEAAENTVSNDLHGVDVRTATDDIKSTLGDGTFYVLSKKNSDFGFFEYTGAYMPARKAFLLVSGNAARNLTMVFEDETTGITTTNYTNYTDSEEYYDLQGRKVEKPSKGLYIVNGRKVVIK